MRGSAFFYRHTPRLVHALRRVCRANYEAEMELLDALADPSRIAVDVGAKVGMYTYRLCKRFASVVAFEPIPLFHDMLRAALTSSGARIEPFALSSRRGTAVMRLPYGQHGERQFGRSTIEALNPLAHRQVARVEELPVETRRLDDYAFARIGLIKIDVEGHELAVLDGAAQSIADSRPALLVECNDDHHPGGRAKLAAWLDAHDYDALFLADRALLPLAQYDRRAHWERFGIENVIGVPRGAAAMRARLEAAARTIGRTAPSS